MSNALHDGPSKHFSKRTAVPARFRTRARTPQHRLQPDRSQRLLNSSSTLGSTKVANVGMPRARLLVLALVVTAAAAAASPQWPARRDKVEWGSDERRAVASRLIRSANRNKERSLRDVLGESRQRDDAVRMRKSVDGVDGASSAEGVVRDEMREGEEEVEMEDESTARNSGANLNSMSELFAWAINSTVYGATANYTDLLFSPVDHDSRPAPEQGHQDMDVEEREVLRAAAKAATVRVQRALPSVASSHASSKDSSFIPPPRAERQKFGFVHDTEFDLMRRNVDALDSKRVSVTSRVNALLMLEELCHSIDNGRDLQISGGIEPIIRAMSNSHDTVRASAAWALATCCQNNPPVQNASVALDAVPILARLAAQDVSSTVRSRALFALNAMLEHEPARLSFEELSSAVQVVRRALVDQSDFRATRRALNLAELLVRRNLDSWKTTLESWDIPPVVDRLMRTHRDIDVRESAARVIAALDGRNLDGRNT